jgi:cell wall-associated NlpC family hydrolase
MSALEAIASEHSIALQKLIAVVDNTTRAEDAAAGAVARAQAAVDEAARAEQDLANRKRDAEMRIDEAERLLGRLSPQQRRDHNGPGAAAPDIPLTGSGVGVQALKAAITRIGKPYVWGATGPNSFDCSGLTSWAFKQVGVTIPRGSSAQAGIGKPVSWDQMQPGDLVFYYQPVSHVGIYAGGGTMVDAPQSGDNVKYNRVSRAVFAGARRL